MLELVTNVQMAEKSGPPTDVVCSKKSTSMSLNCDCSSPTSQPEGRVSGMKANRQALIIDKPLSWICNCRSRHGVGTLLATVKERVRSGKSLEMHFKELYTRLTAIAVRSIALKDEIDVHKVVNESVDERHFARIAHPRVIDDTDFQGILHP